MIASRALPAARASGARAAAPTFGRWKPEPCRRETIRTFVFEDKRQAGEAAAEQAAATICRSVQENGTARIVVGTGASQFEFLGALTRRRDVPWAEVEMFHLDEYIGMSPEHPASFRKYLMERFIDPTGVRKYHFLDGTADPHEVSRAVGAAIASAPVDCAFVGIGENGHLAFNDPPADFATAEPFIIVQLDEPCRRQQVGEGWFSSIDQVPRQAITMSIRQILASREIICVVPDARKAPAVQRCLEGPVTPDAPASILQTHGHTTVYLDRASAALLQQAPRTDAGA